MSSFGDSWQPHMRDVDRDLTAALQRQFAAPDLSLVLAEVRAAAAEMPQRAGVSSQLWLVGLLMLLGLAGSSLHSEAAGRSEPGPSAAAQSGLSATLAELAVVGALAGTAALRSGQLQRLPQACRRGLRLPEGLRFLGRMPAPVAGEVAVLESAAGPVAVLIEEAVPGRGPASAAADLLQRRLGRFWLSQPRSSVPVLAGFALSGR